MENSRLLRFVTPVLYKKMVEIFSDKHIHPYDVVCTATKDETGVEVTVRFSTNFSESATAIFSMDQAMLPDEQVTRFFEETADKCKTHLIADYYKMIKL